LKPGKPLWFGVLPSDPVDKLVFGLPGNPVSSLVCCELFVRPAIAKMCGRSDVGARCETALLAADFQHRGDRPTYHPGRLQAAENGTIVEPLRWLGSADLRGLAAANALIRFAAGDRRHTAGATVDVVRFD
jgi:molybdopterin molybdotransferase